MQILFVDDLGNVLNLYAPWEVGVAAGVRSRSSAGMTLLVCLDRRGWLYMALLLGGRRSWGSRSRSSAGMTLLVCLDRRGW